jgi:hypothetical protein
MQDKTIELAERQEQRERKKNRWTNKKGSKGCR